MQHSLRPTANSKDKYVPKGKRSVHVAVNVGNIGQRRAACVFYEEVALCVGSAQWQNCYYIRNALYLEETYISYLIIYTEVVTICTAYFKVK